MVRPAIFPSLVSQVLNNVTCCPLCPTGWAGSVAWRLCELGRQQTLDLLLGAAWTGAAWFTTAPGHLSK
jgi:hypothetical protein